jgi:hypothetical protein
MPDSDISSPHDVGDTMTDQGPEPVGDGEDAPGSRVAATLLALTPFALLALLWGLDRLIR